MIINANLIQLATQKEFRHVFGSLCRWLQILNHYEWNIEGGKDKNLIFYLGF